MATRNIVKGTEVLAVTNRTANSLFIGEIAIPVSATVDVPVENVSRNRERSADLGALIASGSITVTLSGVALTEALARSLEAPSVAMASLATVASPQLPVWANATRPGPTTVPAGYAIFNTDDAAINICDGTDWRDEAGSVT